MKYILTALLLFAFLSTSFAIENYKTGDQLYIWATSGLNMRISPDAKSKKLLNIPYGKSIKVTDTDLQAHPFSYSMVNKWKVDGHWVKISYQNQEGYVFDAYLGRYPAVTSSPEEIPGITLEHLKNYGKEHWEGLDTETKESILNFDIAAGDPEKGLFSSYTLKFKNGSSYNTESQAYTGTTTLFVKDTSMEEAYLMFNALMGFEYKNGKSGNNGMSGAEIRLLDVKKNEIHFIRAEMNSIIIKKTKGGVTITVEGGC